MSDHVRPADLLEWCRVPVDELVGHPRLRVPFRLVEDSADMGDLMARELVEIIEANNRPGPPDPRHHPLRPQRAGTSPSPRW